MKGSRKMNCNSTHGQFLTELKDSFNKIPEAKITELIRLVRSKIEINARIYIFGNGGSAAFSSHVMIDYMKVMGAKVISASDAAYLTCFANDFGYEEVYRKFLEYNVDKQDFVILISSSGNSKNIVNAASYCEEHNIDFVTLSGFDESNRLNQFSTLSFHVDSENYNVVELTHETILLSVVEDFIRSIK